MKDGTGGAQSALAAALPLSRGPTAPNPLRAGGRRGVSVFGVLELRCKN